MFSKVLRNLKSLMNGRIDQCNGAFNGLTQNRKRVIVIAFGICITGISAMLIIQALSSQETQIDFKPERIAMPYDIFKKEEAAVSENQLIPVGKMKGEIDGDFESFYVAVDNKGSIDINREIEYSERAYEKTDVWKQISRAKLAEYEKELHFIPSRSRGVRR